MVNDCGVVMAMLPGQQLGTSLVDRLSGERGNRPRSPFLLAIQVSSGQVRGRLTAVGRGGGSVVVRARLAGTARRYPNLFAHWQFGLKPDGWAMGAV
ncbi:hypothetical protein ABT218_37215 [Streptomyces sp. NPDC001455]|uniref:hypothetical protein n=1 Tax=unclassified Streptomyces TaxID=2593676 RepID=UPI00331F7D73